MLGVPGEEIAEVSGEKQNFGLVQDRVGVNLDLRPFFLSAAETLFSD